MMKRLNPAEPISTPHPESVLKVAMAALRVLPASFAALEAVEDPQGAELKRQYL
jgi:hypothetical protein